MTFFRRRKIHKLRIARAEAQATYNHARRAGDTRAQHAAQKALQAATHALMRVEVRYG